MFGVGIIFINSNNKIILLLRDDASNISFPNKWNIPGGRIEEDETPGVAARREMKEELGLDNLNEINFLRFTKVKILLILFFGKNLILILMRLFLMKDKKFNTLV